MSRRPDAAEPNAGVSAVAPGDHGHHPPPIGHRRPATAVGTDPDTGVPVHIGSDRTLMLKVIDACGMTCTFCHNEGTPVLSDNVRRSIDDLTGSGPSGRVSIYLGSNGARFLPATVAPDAELERTLVVLRDSLGVDELHLTGGEPTLHPRLPEIIGVARRHGYTVCATSNGENGGRLLPDCAAAGLDRVNFSIFGTTADELALVQHAKFADPARAERKIRALHESIDTALAGGLGVSANIVVPDRTHMPRVHRLLDEFASGMSVRLLNSLDDGQASVDAIFEILEDLRAVPVSHHVTAGASGFRTAFRLPSGRVVQFKQIRGVRLPETCRSCRFNNERDCHEGYYGVRLYRDRAGGFQVGVCIQRMDLCLPIDEFVGSALRDEVVELRTSEFRDLVSTYAAR